MKRLKVYVVKCEGQTIDHIEAFTKAEAKKIVAKMYKNPETLEIKETQRLA